MHLYKLLYTLQLSTLFNNDNHNKCYFAKSAYQSD